LASKLYRLESDGGRGHIAHTVHVLPDGDMARAYDLVNVTHSGGFAWGYPGAGPTALGSSIVADIFGESPQLYWTEATRGRLHGRAVMDRFLIDLAPAIDVHVLDADEIQAFCLGREKTCRRCGGTGIEPQTDTPVEQYPPGGPCFRCEGLKLEAERVVTH